MILYTHRFSNGVDEANIQVLFLTYTWKKKQNIKRQRFKKRTNKLTVKHCCESYKQDRNHKISSLYL